MILCSSDSPQVASPTHPPVPPFAAPTRPPTAPPTAPPSNADVTYYPPNNGEFGAWNALNRFNAHLNPKNGKNQKAGTKGEKGEKGKKGKKGPVGFFGGFRMQDHNKIGKSVLADDSTAFNDGRKLKGAHITVVSSVATVLTAVGMMMAAFVALRVYNRSITADIADGSDGGAERGYASMSASGYSSQTTKGGPMFFAEFGFVNRLRHLGSRTKIPDYETAPSEVTPLFNLRSKTSEKTKKYTEADARDEFVPILS